MQFSLIEAHGWPARANKPVAVLAAMCRRLFRQATKKAYHLTKRIKITTIAQESLLLLETVLALLPISYEY